MIAKQQGKKLKKKPWLIVGGSATGAAHLEAKIPCQDAYSNSKLNSKWFITVVSDGAGSYENSHLGSAFVTKNAITVFRDLLKGEASIRGKSVPSSAQWRDISVTGLSLVFDNMLTFAAEKNISYKSLGCTVIVALYSSNAVMIAHIGDGRAAVKTEEDSWIPAMTPFKGVEVGSTTFITSDSTWSESSARIASRVIRQPIKAFAILTDGLEAYTYLCNKKKNGLNVYYDPNEPFSAFFDHNIKWIKYLHSVGRTKKQIEDALISYLHHGHPEIAGEIDDKTLVLGALLNT